FVSLLVFLYTLSLHDALPILGFSDYFLIVYDFVQFAKRKQIAVGPGRGSAAGSIVAYLLGITDVDPLKYNLLFERFLNPERVSKIGRAQSELQSRFDLVCRLL